MKYTSTFSIQEVEEAKQYWISKLSDEYDNTRLFSDFKKNKETKKYIAYYKIDDSLFEQLTSFCKNNIMSFYVVAVAAFKVLLCKYTQSNDIIISTPVLSEDDTNIQNNVFIPLRHNSSMELTFKELLLDIKDTIFKGHLYQFYPFTELSDSLKLNRSQLLRYALIIDNIHNVSNMMDIINSDENDITFSLNMTQQFIECKIYFNPDAINEINIKSMYESYLIILECIINNNDMKIACKDIVSETEKNKILYKFNPVFRNITSKPVHQLFEDQAARMPDNTALVFQNEILTYNELNIRANQLASVIRNTFMETENIVGILIERSFDMIIAILAVLKAGKIYLPIDCEFPAKRINYMLKDSEASILLTNKRLSDQISFDGSTIDINYDIYKSQNISNPQNISTLDNLAYIMYTSGSTGEPKGVMISHGNLCNFFEAITERIEFKPEESIINLTTISFDIFITETLLPLVKGLKVVIASKEQQKDIMLLKDVIKKNNIDILQTTPSRMKLFTRDFNTGSCLENLSKIMVGGEAFPNELAENIRRFSNAKIYNMYGPTETTVWSSAKEINRADDISIGAPILNTHIYILDQNRNLLPVGAIGELYISGNGVAKGYLNRPSLNEERFMDNPFWKERKMYRTGDLGKWLENGEIEFIGRSDEQVKIRGYRIETKEIEEQLIKFKDIENSIVYVKEDNLGQKFLVAYYVSEQEIHDLDIQKYLEDILPEYMVPRVYIKLEEIPLSPSGKVQKQLLPYPQVQRNEMSVESNIPKTDIQKLLLEIWQDVLDRKSVGLHDNFFAIGGNSMMLVMMVAQLDIKYPGRVTVEDIFAHPTIYKLSQFMENINKSENKASIKYFKVPLEYLIQDQETNENLELKINIEKKLFGLLKADLLQNGLEVYDGLLAIFSLLLMQITKHEMIYINFVKHEQKIYPLEINLKDIEEFDNLLRYVNHTLESTKEYCDYSVLTSNGIKKNINDYSVAILFAYDTDTPRQVLDYFDIAFKVSCDNEVDLISISCEYNSDRINNEKMKHMIMAYDNLIKVLYDNDNS